MNDQSAGKLNATLDAIRAELKLLREAVQSLASKK